MSHDSRGNEPDQVNNGALAVVLGIVALATLAVALVVTALVRDEVRELSAVRDGTQDREYRDLKAGQLGKLEAAPSWVDKTQGVVSLPIARAMALTLDEVRANPAKLSPWFTSVAPPEAAIAEGTAASPAVADAASTPAVVPVGSGAPDVKTPAASTPSAPAAAPALPATKPAVPPTKVVAPANVAPAATSATPTKAVAPAPASATPPAPKATEPSGQPAL